MKAEDILPDDVNESLMNGVHVRKGSVGAFLANARVLLDPASTAEDRATAERDIVDGLPTLRALGLFDAMHIRDERLRALVEAHADHRY